MGVRWSYGVSWLAICLFFIRSCSTQALEQPQGEIKLGQDASPVSAGLSPAFRNSPPSKAPELMIEIGSTISPIGSTGTNLSERVATSGADPLDSGDNPLKQQHKFSKYLAPICASLDRLSSKQFQTIQSQFKKFSRHGKVGHCFMTQYNFDPNVRPLNKLDLVATCDSRNQSTGLGYSAFEKCLDENWVASLDKEVSAINDIRVIASTDHQHVTNDPNLDALSHDDDDLSLIGQVVSRVLGAASNSTASGKNNSVLITTSELAAAKPVSETDSIENIANISLAPDKALKVDEYATTQIDIAHSKINLADTAAAITMKPSLVPGTIPITQPPMSAVLSPTQNSIAPALTSGIGLVAVAPSSGPKLVAPSDDLRPNANSLQTVSPSITTTPSVDSSVTTPDPFESIKLKLSFSSGVKLISTTAAPIKHQHLGDGALNSMKIKLSIQDLPAKNASVSLSEIITSTVKPSATATTNIQASGSTEKPVSSAYTTTPFPLLVLKMSTNEPKSLKVVLTSKYDQRDRATATLAPDLSEMTSISSKAVEMLEQLLRRHEVELADLESKFKVERESILKQVRNKPRDELATATAIRSLQQQQRDVAIKAIKTGSKDPHQLEHERQMLLDPVGHTLKHREYERLKAGEKDKDEDRMKPTG